MAATPRYTSSVRRPTFATDNFPSVKFHAQHFEDELEGDQGLAVLEMVVTALLEQTDFFSWHDSVGAMPIHALLVANNDISLRLVLRICELKPDTMTSRHATGPFLGEVPRSLPAPPHLTPKHTTQSASDERRKGQPRPQSAACGPACRPSRSAVHDPAHPIP